MLQEHLSDFFFWGGGFDSGWFSIPLDAHVNAPLILLCWQIFIITMSLIVALTINSYDKLQMLVSRGREGERERVRERESEGEKESERERDREKVLILYYNYPAPFKSF